MDEDTNPARGTTGVASAYDRWAGSYDSAPNRTRDLAAAVLRVSGLRRRGRDVVEIGCGTGRNTAWLLEGADRGVGLDLSLGMLARARGRISSGQAPPRLALARGDLTAPWPLGDASADLVVETLVLEHVRELEPFFHRATRVLRPGGELFCCELHPLRQRQGKQANFRDPDSGETVRVAAYLHDTAEYLTAGLEAGLELRHLGEWGRKPGRGVGAELPWLLSVRFRRPADGWG